MNPSSPKYEKVLPVPFPRDYDTLTCWNKLRRSNQVAAIASVSPLPSEAVLPVNSVLRVTAAFLWIPIVFSALTLGCSPRSSNHSSSGTVLRVATTTSTQDSGLLDEILPTFEQRFECRIDVIAVGTGAALRLGQNGDAEVVLVHAREAEEEFMAAGHGQRHEEFMVNDFLLLGPTADPANIRDMQPMPALQQIASGEFPFISRGDDSGTHKRELGLWQQIPLVPMWSAYLESGQGMGATLIMADEKRAYALADQGTYLRFKNKISLVPLTAHSSSLRNPYAAIVVRQDGARQEKTTLANAFVDFLLEAKTQQRIAEFRVAGEPLFTPTRHPINK